MKIRKLLTWAAIAVTIFLSSCSKDDDAPLPDAIRSYSGIVVNQGNFGEYNGSLSLYNENGNTVKNLAFKTTNGRPVAAFAESFVHNGKVGLLLCNNPSKIEVVGMDSLQTLHAPLQGGDIVNPRYGAVVGQYAYITCWGSSMAVIGQYPGTTYDMYSFDMPYLLKIDLNTFEVVKKIACSGGDAEGVIAYNNKLYVAVIDGVVVVDAATDTEVAHIKHNTLSRFAKHLAVDKNGKLWYSVSGSGFGIINTSTLTLEEELSVPGTGGCIAVTRAKDKILFIQQESVSYAPVKAEIYTVNVDTKAVARTPIYTGKQLIGVSVNPKTGAIYTAEIWNYTANSTLKVLDESGKLLNEQVVGVAASRFVFF